MPSVRLEQSLDYLMSHAGDIGAQGNETPEVRLQHTLLIANTLRFGLVSIAVGLIYWLSGEPLTSAVLLIYALLSLPSIVMLRRTHKGFRIVIFSQLTALLLIPLMMTFTLGGFVASSVVIVWALLCPLTALVYLGTRPSWPWLFAFIATIVLATLLQSYAPPNHILSATFVECAFVINMCAVAGIAFSMLYYFIQQRGLTLDLLRVEREKSENLLLNVLPQEIAAKLKDDDRIIADHFDAVTVLFADVANFTPLSAILSAADVVDVLNQIFSYFDALAEKYGLEKIKTIGDCYMAAAGVPNTRSDHAQATAQMALAMSDYVCKHPALTDGKRMDFRIGIHSGPVVAGVIGRKKFIYDLWGDSVNTASRMESHGVPGKIQITQETYSLISDTFICEPRGKVMVKGKGEMETWYLVGERKVANEI